MIINRYLLLKHVINSYYQ